MTYDLILNEFAGKVHLGYLPRECSLNFWQNGFLRAFYITKVEADLDNQTLVVKFNQAEAYAPNGEMVHELPYPFPKPANVTEETAYVLDGLHPSGLTWFQVFCMIPVVPNEDGTPNEIGKEFWEKSMDGMLHIVAYQHLLPGILDSAKHKTMPFNTGPYTHPIFVDFDERGITPVAGAQPFEYSLNGADFAALEEVPELLEGENTLIVRDALGNEKTLTYNAPAE